MAVANLATFSVVQVSLSVRLFDRPVNIHGSAESQHKRSADSTWHATDRDPGEASIRSSGSTSVRSRVLINPEALRAQVAGGLKRNREPP